VADVCDFSIPGDGGMCYECDAECVGAVFCGFGGQDSPDVRLPKVLNVAIQANPEFWGFGGVLFSGDITYSSSKFDYWNNFEENWLVDKTCGDTTIRDLDNEQRPDVKYRSVYDPDTGTTTYDGNTEIDEIGGPSVYLIDRDATKTTDAVSCDETDPGDVFRHHPENFGFGNKILFEEDIYKNISAAWRGADTGIPNFTFNESGLPDGAVVGQYAGNVTGVYRDTATDPFIHLRVQYTGGQASAIRNGQILYLNSTCANQAYESQYLPDGAYYLTKVTDNGSYTDCALVGSVGTEDFSESLTSSTWTIAGSLDEQTCRSKRAHGVDYENKCADLDYNYHADLGVVINDSRNRIHSNRTTRDKFGWTNTRSADDKPRRDYTYVSVQESGHGLLVKEEETDNVALVCETGIWNPTWDFIYTSGDDYYSAFKPEDLFSVSGYHSDAPSTLVNIGSGLIETCGCNSGEALGLCDISTECLPLGWSKYAVSSGMYPMYGRELPFYGPFYEVYDKDNVVRNWQQDNTIKARNNTCYTPLATLEVYPDCITQENKYGKCGGGDTHLINNVSRLAFVYRCFDYQEPCSYDESGRPYDGMPTNVNDLRRGLAGQEVYMYINWGDAWAGEIARDPCSCTAPIPGSLPPRMMEISSPVTFPCFPKFDLDPSSWGAEDQLWKRYAANLLETEPVGSFECPVELTGDYSFLQQPYTTYGFIRNVCGKETNSSKAVIQALNDVNAGTYRNTTPLDNTVEPMYWEFPIVYGDLNGTPVPWNSGLSGGFVNDSGTLATWGIVDGNNRVVAPYYPVTSGINYDYCDPATINSTYPDFDEKAAFRGEWPTSSVPFLITIDHNNNCGGCGTVGMPSDAVFNLSIASLDRSYSHNVDNKYGYTHCTSGGSTEDIRFALDPVFACPTGGFSTDICFTGDGLVASNAVVNTSSSCDCADSISITMTGVPLEGAGINKYWISTNPNSTNNLNNFMPIDSCEFDGPKYWWEEPQLGFSTANINYGQTIKTPYLLAKFGCQRGYTSFYDPTALTNQYLLYNGANPLLEYYGCTTCTHSYPSVNNRPDLFTDWWVVMDNYRWLFDNIPTEQVYLIEDQLKEGVNQPTLAPCATSGLPSGDAIFSFGLPGCSGSTLTAYGCRIGGGIIYDGYCETGSPPVYLGDTGCFRTDECGNTYYDLGELESLRDLRFLPSTAVCGCLCADTGDAVPIISFEWIEGTGWYSSGNGYDWQSYIGADCADDWEYPPEFPVMKFFSGTNLPSFGTFSIMPFNDPIAGRIAYSDPQPACQWKEDVDPNAFTNVDYKINPPGQHSDVRNDSPCSELWPNYCDVQWGACSGYPDVYRSTCLTPIYGDNSVQVRKKRAYPEIMTVHKIDCLGEGNGYNLHVSREYHSHNRSWYYPLDGYTCDKYKGAIRGGGYNWRISWTGVAMDPAPCPSFPYHPCSSDFAAINCVLDGFCFPTGDGWGLEGPVPGYAVMDHSVPSDQVTPAYPTINNSAISTSQSLCANHPHSGDGEICNVTRDFRYDEQPYKAAYTEWFPQQTGVPVPYPLYGNCSGLFEGYSGFADQDAILYAFTLGASYANNALVELALQANCEITGTGYQIEYEDWYLPKYTGIIDPEDPSFGGICGIIGNTGEAVRTWYQGDTISLSLCDQQRLEPTDEYVYYLASGCSGCACSGYTWAESGEYTPYELFRLEDENFEYRYYTVLSPSGLCDDIRRRHPDLKDQTFWNYYNLFYGSGYPDDRFYNNVELIPQDPEGDCNDPGRHLSPWNFNPIQGGPPGNTDDPHFGPIYNDATDIPLNRRHSCIQDSTQCGGELWNNKMFFPRKPYEAGTRVTAFGALSLCTQDTTYETASWLEGYEDLSSNGTPDILREALQTRFIDACDTDAHSVTLQSSAGIDDVIIHVSDYLPLLGMYFVDRKMNLGDYTCLQPDDGCYDFLPIHSDQTLDKMSFVPAKTWSNDKEVSFGYYLDKLVTDAQDQCLFKPFKIMVDVDCCPDIIRKIGQEDDIYEPTYLSWVDTSVPAEICNWYYEQQTCSCLNTSCNESYRNRKQEPSTCLNALNIYYGTSCTGTQDIPCNFGCTGEYQFLNVSGVSTIVSDNLICSGSGTGLDFDIYAFDAIPDCILIDTTDNNPWSQLSTGEWYEYGGKKAICRTEGEMCVGGYDANGNCLMWTPITLSEEEICYLTEDNKVTGYTYNGVPVSVVAQQIPVFQCGDSLLAFQEDIYNPTDCCSLWYDKCNYGDGLILPTGVTCFDYNLSTLSGVASQLGANWWTECCDGPVFLFDTTISDPHICDDPSNIRFTMTEA